MTMTDRYYFGVPTPTRLTSLDPSPRPADNTGYIDSFPDLVAPNCLGGRVRAERKRRNLNTTEAAKIMGISPIYLTNIEEGKTDPKSGKGFISSLSFIGLTEEEFRNTQDPAYLGHK